jgi:ATP-dependent RNA helicase RhlE
MQTTESFQSLGLDPLLLKAVQRLGYNSPTQIQAESIPAILKGRDVIGSARTGSGKTAAFLLPIIQKLAKHPGRRTRVLVLSPTRELAVQTENMLKELARGTSIRGKAVYGGVGMHLQVRALRDGVDLVTATPGRLLDHTRRGHVDFRDLQVLVLDEADRMLDMGFFPDVRQIVNELPKKRQTLLFSATIPREVEQLARQIMHEPLRVTAGQQDTPPESIHHTVYPVQEYLKTGLLIELLRRGGIKSVLVFTRTKWRANRLAQDLFNADIRTGLIHGGRTQSQRETALDGFRTGREQVLVATDVAARGLDIQGISHVVNYDVPPSSTDYIHRVGRTARVDAKGDAITLVSPHEEEDLRRIGRDLKYNFLGEEVPGFNYDAPPPPRSSHRPERRGEYRPSGDQGSTQRRHPYSRGQHGQRRSRRGAEARSRGRHRYFGANH